MGDRVKRVRVILSAARANEPEGVDYLAARKKYGSGPADLGGAVPASTVTDAAGGTIAAPVALAPFRGKKRSRLERSAKREWKAVSRKRGREARKIKINHVPPRDQIGIKLANRVGKCPQQGSLVGHERKNDGAVRYRAFGSGQSGKSVFDF